MKFLVATMVGGLMEMPKISYENFDIIEAENEDQACAIYNEKYGCSYFYGSCIAIKEEGQVRVLKDEAPYKWIKMLENS